MSELRSSLGEVSGCGRVNLALPSAGEQIDLTEYSLAK